MLGGCLGKPGAGNPHAGFSLGGRVQGQPRPVSTDHRVKHDKWMRLVQERVADRRVLHLIDRSLKAGVLTGDGCEATVEGTPPGGPLSPLVAKLLRDALDKERERRGHRCVRSADASHIYVRSARAGYRVRASVTRCLERRLKRTVHAATRAVDRPWRRTLLGCTCTGRRPHRRQGRDKALKALKQEVRQRTGRTRGVPRRRLVHELRQSLEGWDASFRVAEAPSTFQELDSWGRRRLRCYVWQQWGRRRYRELG